MCMLMCMCMLNKQSFSLNKQSFSLNRRVQILFDKDLWNKLTKATKSQNISVGEFIRRAVRIELDKQKEVLSEEKRTPFNRLFKSRSK